MVGITFVVEEEKVFVCVVCSDVVCSAVVCSAVVVAVVGCWVQETDS